MCVSQEGYEPGVARALVCSAGVILPPMQAEVLLHVHAGVLVMMLIVLLASAGMFHTANHMSGR